MLCCTDVAGVRYHANESGMLRNEATKKEGVEQHAELRVEKGSVTQGVGCAGRARVRGGVGL